jgi:PhoH-like ATPase
MSKRKTVILDTSAILYDKNSIENFSGCDVVIPLIVLDELDRFKEKQGSLGENARYANRLLDDLRSKGPLHKGVPMGDDSTLSIRLVQPEIPQSFPLNPDDSDNKILLEGLQMKSESPQKSIVVVSKDINLRVKCDAVGLSSEDYYTDYIDLPEDNWSGIVEIQPEDGMIDALYRDRQITYESDLSPNAFVVLKSPTGQSALCVYDAYERRLILVPDNDIRLGGSPLPVVAKNKEQKFAMWALQNPKIPLFTMTGLAGSGKTFLSLIAGISEIQQNRYERIVITRNLQPVGREIGYLPGDMTEKMTPWMAPVIDNLRNHFKDKSAWDLMRANGLIEIAPMSFIRGRTFTNSYIILDEAQNATIHELKTVITRVGEGSKIILMGDTDQIDTPYINKHTNGLSLVTKKLRDSLHTGHVNLPVGIRSTIASEASHLL